MKQIFTLFYVYQCGVISMSAFFQLPILRVFGATPQGNKTCLHIHGVFPYLYIPCDDPNPEPKTAYQVTYLLNKHHHYYYLLE